MKLFQKKKKAGIKFLDIKTSGAKLITTWGIVGGKTQTTTKVCKGTNIGKSNETTPEKQAKLEMKAKLELKKKKGYTTTKPSEDDTIVQAKINLDKLPVNLCPNKPISKAPESVLNGKTTYGQRKHNGQCLILVKGKLSQHIYTRRMEDISLYVSELPPIKEMMSRIPAGSMVLSEMTYCSKQSSKEVPRFVGSVIHKEDATEALARYNELEKPELGFFKLYPFDTLFWEGTFVGDTDYQDRWLKLRSVKHAQYFDVPELLPKWREILEKAEKDNWEGFILRVPGEKSHVSYTMDGTAHRAGSWKYKFVQEGDFIVDQALKGKSGKHANFYAKFHVSQYDEKGNLIDRGYVGCGKLTHEELAELTKEINSQKRRLPFVVEIEYQSIHDDSGKLEFGQIQRIRDDKKPEECIAE